MSERTDIVSILSGKNIQKNIDEILDSDDRFNFLESLRKISIENRVHNSENEDSKRLVISLLDAESESILNQYKRIDTALVSILKAENRLSSLKNHLRKDNPDLPDDPKSLRDPKVAFRYGLMRQYRRQFEVTINEQKNGAWPLLVNDLLEPIDGKRTLLIGVLPSAVLIHSSPEFLTGFSSAMAASVGKVLQDTQADIAKRLANSVHSDQFLSIRPSGKIDKIIKAIKKLYEWAEIMITTIEAYRITKELAEKAEEIERERQEQISREEWNKFKSDSREIEGSSNHVDHFDKNRDIIRGTC